MSYELFINFFFFSVFVVCRRGNDSQKAVLELEKVLQGNKAMEIKDIKGGLHAWARIIDPNFPIY